MTAPVVHLRRDGATPYGRALQAICARARDALAFLALGNPEDARRCALDLARLEFPDLADGRAAWAENLRDGFVAALDRAVGPLSFSEAAERSPERRADSSDRPTFDNADDPA